MIRRIHRKSNNSRNSVKRFEAGRSNSRSRNVRNTRSRRFETQHVNNRRLRRRFEAFETQGKFEASIRELQKLARDIRSEYGDDVADEINVVFWAKDGTGTPCLVEGSYNYWSGDEELTFSELADGAVPSSFISKLDRYIEKEPEYIAMFLAEHVANAVRDDLNLDADWQELKDIMWKEGDRDIDFDALVSYVRDNFDVDEDDLDEMDYDSYAADHEESFLSYGWEYSTVNQGNLWYGRTNHVEGPTFGEVIMVGGSSEDIREWDGAHSEEDINEKGLRKLADAIAQGKTERPRW